MEGRGEERETQRQDDVMRVGTVAQGQWEEGGETRGRVGEQKRKTKKKKKKGGVEEGGRLKKNVDNKRRGKHNANTRLQSTTNVVNPTLCSLYGTLK